MYKFVQLNGAHQGRQYILGPYQTFGRAPTNNIVIEDPRVSREQGIIQVQGDLVMVIANNQASPIFLNGH